MRRALHSAETLTAWANNNGIILNGVTISTSPGGHGTGLIATTSCNETGSIFVQVPAQLLLNESQVWKLSRVDPDLATILAANTELANSTRGVVLIFLLMQITHSSPDVLLSGYVELPIGRANAFSEYIQYIQTEESLPLFWSEEEISQLWGTSLQRHHAAKMRFLRAEFEIFTSNCRELPWANVWFGQKGCLTFRDWLTVDAMWRSRAMDLSNSDDGADGQGSCLVPIMDMANHATDGIAAYKLFASSDGSPCARLILDKPALEIDSERGYTNSISPDRLVREGDEITISYGSIKGATEMIFSYGFLDGNMSDARSMMLGWNLPEDDPLSFEKVAALDLEPGFQIYTPVSGSKTVRFVGTAVWAMSVNEEDGLRIVADRGGGDTHGESQLTDAVDLTDHYPNFKMFFKNTLITSKSHLIDVLTHDRAALVFRTRAMAYVYMRIEEELERMSLHIRQKLEAEAHEDGLEQEEPDKLEEENAGGESKGAKVIDGGSQPSPSSELDPSPSHLTEQSNQSPGHSHLSTRAEICILLRALELKLLERASNYFSTELIRLTEHPDVINYPILLEVGLALPDLSGEEQWQRFEGEHDEESRREYASALETQLCRLTEQEQNGGKSCRDLNGPMKLNLPLEQDRETKLYSMTAIKSNEPRSKAFVRSYIRIYCPNINAGLYHEQAEDGREEQLGLKLLAGEQPSGDYGERFSDYVRWFCEETADTWFSEDEDDDGDIESTDDGKNERDATSREVELSEGNVLACE